MLLPLERPKTNFVLFGIADPSFLMTSLNNLKPPNDETSNTAKIENSSGKTKDLRNKLIESLAGKQYYSRNSRNISLKGLPFTRIKNKLPDFSLSIHWPSKANTLAIKLETKPQKGIRFKYFLNDISVAQEKLFCKPCGYTKIHFPYFSLT